MSEQAKIFYGFGRFFSPFYGFAMSLRAALYKKGVMRRDKLSVPVISVGNLTMGGTGKTPMTIYLARLLKDLNPVIVSRGYGGKAKKKVNVVSDGKEICLSASVAGDEPFHMAQTLPSVPVVTSRKRVDGGRYAVSALQAGAVILDDGFQHLALDRDINLALFKVDSFLGNNRVFPGGDMREPLKALNRADCFILNCVDEDNRKRADAIKKALLKKFGNIPVFMTGYKSLSLVTPEGKELPLAVLQGEELLGFCGLADPHSFERSLELAKIKTVGFQAFRDHCPYLRPELELIQKQVVKCKATALITTEKDLVKLAEKDLQLPLYALKMEMVPEDGFDNFILEQLSSTS